jgi:hypothetical protein
MGPLAIYKAVGPLRGRKGRSLQCNPIVNTGCTLHSNLPVVSLDTRRENEPSPSVNPVKNQGLREDLVNYELPLGNAAAALLV